MLVLSQLLEHIAIVPKNRSAEAAVLEFGSQSGVSSTNSPGIVMRTIKKDAHAWDGATLIVKVNLNRNIFCRAILSIVGKIAPVLE